MEKANASQILRLEPLNDKGKFASQILRLEPLNRKGRCKPDLRLEPLDGKGEIQAKF